MMELFRLRTPDGDHHHQVVELLLEHRQSEALSKILLKAHQSSSSTDNLRRELVSFFSSMVSKDEE